MNRLKINPAIMVLIYHISQGLSNYTYKFGYQPKMPPKCEETGLAVIVDPSQVRLVETIIDECIDLFRNSKS